MVEGVRSVLVVDGDRLVCWALEKGLAAREVAVDTAGTGADARERIRDGAYRLAFVNAALPDADGLDLLREIRDASPGTCVVMLGCDTAADRKTQAFARGACQFLDKPFELDEVLSIVGSLLDEHPERRAHERLLCRLPLRLAVVWPPSEGLGRDLGDFAATALDVSCGGLGLRTAFPLEPGQTLRVEVLRSDDPCARRVPPGALARVIWVRPGNGGAIVGLGYAEPIRDRTS